MAYKKYIVKQGDCISSIAFKFGFFPDTIWNDPKNSKLKQDRENPNVLSPGDEVYIRDKEEKEESRESEQRHRFRRIGVPEKLRLKLLHHDKPRANIKYKIAIDGLWLEGETDDKGKLQHWIPPDARQGKLILSNGEEYELTLGHLPPVAEESGVIARLANLGYLNEEDFDKEEFEEALELFQHENDLEVTGEADDVTCDKLLEVHGS